MLALIELLLLVLAALIVVTQIAVPAIRGRKLFPAFRTNPIREQVQATREEVELLEEQVANTAALAKLKQKHADLEKQISADESKQKDAQ